MKDLGENIHWAVTIKTFFIYLGKCFYVLFSSNGALLRKLRHRFGMYSHSTATSGRTSTNRRGPLVVL
jgi:hypothetical protein